MIPSGASWVAQFPTSRSLDDLAEPFQTKAKAFIAALRAASASVAVADTLRPPQRAHLMHYSFAIARLGADSDGVPVLDGVDIQWTHMTAAGVADPVASKAGAEAMVQGYGIVFQPALASRHTQGLAVDMDITWQGDLVIAMADGSSQTISSTPRTGAANSELQSVGASYGVVKLLSDPPHWSSDGH